MTDFRVRRARVDDAAPIADIHIAAWTTAYRGIMADEILDSLDLDRQTAGWTRSLSDETSPMSTLVAVQGQRVLGFGGVCPPRDTAEVLSQLPEASGLGQLAAINLHPEAFGSGAGALLLHALEDELQALGFTRAYLMVAEGNDRAMRFYAKHGWHRTEITHVFDGVSPAVPERMFTINLG
ncbi:GNAT family N-acetyltransferase [Brevibacterium sp. ZH18]|uniref:GNAT family N-acetyltransferase n=1 Tax=Brevibacterium sp. ZH18 TaxID=2927784 RepID=UPI001F61D6F6|nr:GNAT family N-acetyltransferase [Brevibacterium sp. ZH18]MCI4010106.1 GNAT family N-acetyltransferase [Brevibacterium sp. ZH18]